MVETITPIVERFNRALEKRILEVLRQQTLQLNHPNESAVVDATPWSSNSTVVRFNAELTAESEPLGRRAGFVENQDDEALSASSASKISSELAEKGKNSANVTAKAISDREIECWHMATLRSCSRRRHIWKDV